MTQALNFTPKAIETLSSLPFASAALSAAGVRYITSKLRQAQIFVLGDHGQLLDRSKPRPQVPCSLFRPPFPVVALEYTAVGKVWEEGQYSASACPRRIALAWDWQDDLPAELADWCPGTLDPGVVVASIAFYEDIGLWMPISAAIHLPYEAEWRHGPATPHVEAMVASGRLKPSMAALPGLSFSIVPIMPEVLAGLGVTYGSVEAVQDVLGADIMDELNAYLDLCLALGCKNVSARAYPAPAALNKQRLKAGKLPLLGFHVLELTGAGALPAGGGVGDRSGPRSHLRRGHIRRLAADRITWVNSSIVRGRGFVDKVYSARAVA